MFGQLLTFPLRIFLGLLLKFAGFLFRARLLGLFLRLDLCFCGGLGIAVKDALKLRETLLVCLDGILEGVSLVEVESGRVGLLGLLDCLLEALDCGVEVLNGVRASILSLLVVPVRPRLRVFVPEGRLVNDRLAVLRYGRQLVATEVEELLLQLLLLRVNDWSGFSGLLRSLCG